MREDMYLEEVTPEWARQADHDYKNEARDNLLKIWREYVLANIRDYFFNSPDDRTDRPSIVTSKALCFSETREEDDAEDRIWIRPLKDDELEELQQQLISEGWKARMNSNLLEISW